MRAMTGAILAGMALAAWGGDGEGRAAALRRLESVRVTVDFRETPLAQALDFLREASGLNLVFTPAAAGKDPGAKVTLKARDLGLRTVLRLVLRPRDLGVAWRDGAFQVVTREELVSATVLRMYDVRSHLLRIQDFKGPSMELTTTVRNDAKVVGIVVLEEDGPKEPPIGEEALLGLVKDSTGRRSWDDNPAASINVVHGILMVSQTPAVHAEIERLLAGILQYR